MENGAINRGDPLTSSSKRGYAKKATGACKIIGYALEDADAEGTIPVFAHLRENTAPEVTALQGQVNVLTQEDATRSQENSALVLEDTMLTQEPPQRTVPASPKMKIE